MSQTTPEMVARATQLKDEGNRHFKAGDFVGAEGLYSKAIIADPTNPLLYTNRAMARLRLSMWDSVIADCNACLALQSLGFKAFYYLSQAQLEMQDYDAALENAILAHHRCVETADKSITLVTAQVLRCKKERWDAMDKRRTRDGQQLESEVVELMAKERDGMLAAAEDESEKKAIEEEWEAKISQITDVFEKARVAEEKRRKVPDWAIDDISFAIMVDPVMTKTGKSYERSSLMEHLRRHPSDPLTREPLVPSELRPNLALKQACDEFLEENGWAVDW